ncbi:hypothetical protein Zmor_001640 [Zophobas morio]|uniref:Uncharacterized protein n=1 Tax=Zophobas morio TaxID=2755281 RepID=A0AA38MST0_9CUCU|nr:hypothetical protein Zmor_001640 [Zophobas morio]
MSNYVLSQAAKARECLVPVKSKAAYSKVYEDFQEWRRENSVNGVDENILLAFFEDLSHKYSPNTLWPKLSMLRFFVAYRNKKCTLQPVGKNTFGKIPSKVAEWLGLDNTKAYTGHCGRRTSATLMPDAGASMTTLKRHGGWRSSSVAEGCLANSMLQKNKVAKMIAGVEGEPSVASVTVPGVSIMASHVAQSSQSLVTVSGKSFKTATELNALSKETTNSLTNCEQDSSSFVSGCNRFSGNFENCNFYFGSEK